MRSVAMAAVGIVLFAAPEAWAQRPRCAVVPDTVVGPTERQVRERQELREQIAAVFTAHGAAPRGLLLVDVDTARTGVVRFLDAELPDSTIQAATRVVGEYLRALERGRAYQALVRVDGEYPAVLPGRMHCRPELETVQEMIDGTAAAARRHPQWGKVAAPVTRHADVLVVINRFGKVSWTQLAQSTGDPVLDEAVEGITSGLRFLPASLDGEPMDVRLRFRLTFTIH